MALKNSKKQFQFSSSATIAALALFICLLSWSIGSTIGSGSDMDFHATNIWCAWGEKPGLCESRSVSTDGQFYANVPYMFQMCNGRPIDFFPRCEKSKSHDSMQRLRTAHSEQMNFYYKVMHLFSSRNPTRSIIWMRVLNSTITSLVFLGILVLVTNRTRLAGLTAWTFTVVPTAFLKLPSINPRGWSLLGAMTSWIFFHELVKQPRSNKRRQIILWLAYIASAFLAFATRIDSSIFVIFSTCLILLEHVTKKIAITTRYFILLTFLALSVGVYLRTISRLNYYLNFSTPQGSPIGSFLYFASTRIPEAIAEIWGYEVGQSGNGPAFTGIIGLSLFILAIYTSLQSSTTRQLIFVGLTFIFLISVNYWGLLSISLQAQGHYSAALVSLLLGVSILYSSNKEFFMKSKRTRNLVIGLLGYSHAVALYSYMDLYVTGGENEGVVKSLPLKGWWWNSWSDPNWVLLTGICAFPISLHFAWNYVTNSELEQH